MHSSLVYLAEEESPESWHSLSQMNIPAFSEGLKHCEAAWLPEPELEPQEPVLRKWKSSLPEKLMHICPSELWSLPPDPLLSADAAAGLDAAGEGGGGAALDGGAAGGLSTTLSSTAGPLFAGGVGAPGPAVTVTIVVADSHTVTSSPKTLAGPARAKR